jgi:hypothetical protein
MQGKWYGYWVQGTLKGRGLRKNDENQYGLGIEAEWEYKTAQEGMGT